jgi:hypothetical protein
VIYMFIITRGFKNKLSQWSADTLK